MNDMDHLDPYIDLGDEDEECEPTTEEIEEDIFDPCGGCQGCN